MRADETQEVKLRKLPLINRLTVLTKHGQTITVGGLERSTSESLHSQLHSRVGEILEEILNDAAAKKAIMPGPQITDLRDSITSHLAPGRCLRRSHTAGMTLSAGKLAGQLDERARQKLNAGAGQALRCVNGGAKVFHGGGQSLNVDTNAVEKCTVRRHP